MAEPKVSREIREFLISLHKSYLANTEEMRKAALATGLSLSTVNQAALSAKGSAVTHGLLICYGLQIKPENLQGHLPKFKKMFSKAEKYSALDELIQKALGAYTVDEMLVWLELLLAKDKMERQLGVRKSAGRPRKGVRS